MAEKLSIDVVAKTLGIKSLTDLKAGFDLVMGAIRNVGNVAKDLTETYARQEKANAQMNSVLKSTGGAAGLTAKELQSMASEMQNLTGIGDEVIQEGQNLLLTFTKIGKETFPEATQTILDMSTALGQDMKSSAIQLGKALNDPINGVTALRRVGVSLTDQQRDQIKAFQDSGNIMAAQKVILKELQTEFGGSAKAIGDTFAGSMMKAQAAQGDMKESMGKIISVIGKDFVDAMTKGTQSITAFLSDSDKIATIGASFKVLQEVGKDLAGSVWQQAKKTFSEVKDKLGELIPQGKESSVIFTALAAAGKLMSMAFNIGIKVVGILLKAFIDTVNVVKNAIEVLKAFWDAASGKTKWKDAWEAVKDLGGAYVDVYKNIANSTKDLVKETIDEFKKMPDNVTSSAKDLQNVFKATYGEYKTNLENDVITPTQTGEKTIVEAKKTWVEQLREMASSSKQAWADMSPQEQFEKITKDIKSFGDNAITIVQGVVDTMKMAFDNYYADQLAAASDWKESHLEEVDDWMAQEMERQGVKEETDSERLQREYEEKQAAANAETDVAKKAQLQQEADELKDEQKRALIKEQAAAKKNQIEEDAKKKELKIKKEQFEANKAFQIGQVWINAASSVMGWWAAFGSMGIPGIVLAAVMTAATLAMAGAQTGVIASQTFHAQEGGEITTGGITGDNATLYANKGEAVLQSQDYKSLVGMARGENQGSSTNISIGNITLPSVTNAQQFVEELRNIQRYEKARV